MEVVNLALYDLDLDRGTLMVRQGKGKKDRMVPIGERAAVWIEKYRSDVRHQLVVEPDDGTLFLTADGARFSPNGMTSLARNYVLAADTGKRGACHLFRHTMATQMLENGADIRFIQQMLGHAKLETTQIYTQVSIRKLQEIHRATHPTARHERTPAKAHRCDGRAERRRAPRDLGSRDDRRARAVAARRRAPIELGSRRGTTPRPPRPSPSRTRPRASASSGPETGSSQLESWLPPSRPPQAAEGASPRRCAPHRGNRASKRRARPGEAQR